MSKPVIIDNLSIRIAQGWQGDPVLLARKIAEQIQHQSHELHSSREISLSLQGQFGGFESSVSQQLGQQLSGHFNTSGKRSKGRAKP